MRQRTKLPNTVETHLLADEPHRWANLGLWQSASDSYVTAAEALAREHGNLAGFLPQHQILDVAAGRGGSIFYWQSHFGVHSIDGLEPCKKSAAALMDLTHDDLGSSPIRFVFDKPIKDYLQYPEPSTLTVRPLPHSYDRIVSVDSAYHFDSTESFLAFGQRFLKPGGVMVWSNFYFSQSRALGLKGRLLSLLGVDIEALVDLETLPSLCEAKGLKVLQEVRLDERVMKGFGQFVRRRRKQVPWFSRLSAGWLTIEGTALALQSLMEWGQKGALPDGEAGLGYGIFTVQKVA